MVSAVRETGRQAIVAGEDGGRGIEFGMRLRTLRGARGWSQAQLAKTSGICKERISRLECGHTNDPRASTLRRLAMALGCCIDELA